MYQNKYVKFTATLCLSSSLVRFYQNSPISMLFIKIVLDSRSDTVRALLKR